MNNVHYIVVCAEAVEENSRAVVHITDAFSLFGNCSINKIISILQSRIEEEHDSEDVWSVHLLSMNEISESLYWALTGQL